MFYFKLSPKEASFTIGVISVVDEDQMLTLCYYYLIIIVIFHNIDTLHTKVHENKDIVWYVCLS